ncbi:MAG: hypothetical protein JWO56_2114 [Acidobacteria bacterium]|nr:hypothetical protein [Acidobacteriota bacterium]
MLKREEIGAAEVPSSLSPWMFGSTAVDSRKNEEQRSSNEANGGETEEQSGRR